MHQIWKKKEKNKEGNYLGGISTAHFIDFYTAVFGREVNRWFQIMTPK